MDPVEYDVFISYSRADNTGGWVSGLRDAIYKDFRAFSSEPFRIFFDTEDIRSRQDWELRLRQGLRSSRVLLMCLSPNYLKSRYCRWEWEEFARLQARRVGGGDPVTGVYFVELSGDEPYGAEIAEWRREHAVERVQLENLQPWFPKGVAALQEAEVRARVKALGQGVHDALSQARLAKSAPGNLRRHNPLFVGRVNELRALRDQLAGGAVGVVTAVHGIGGMGKTELAVTYAHAYAADYQGGTWQIDAEGHTDILEAISTLAQSPALKLTVSEEDRRDSHGLGWRVLARLAELTTAARISDPATAACLVLLDNVSEVELLSESQLAVLPEEPWLHLLVTTRLGESDVGGVGSKASVATIPIGPLVAEDALALIREHQPASDPARLHPDFSSPAQEDAARQIVALLDGYTLAIEQAAVYLGVTEHEPSSLLADLQIAGSAVLDEAVAEQPGNTADAATAAIRGKIRHQERLAGRIVDQTLAQLAARARSALAVAALLPADTIPWDWLRELTKPTDTPPPSTGLRGLSSSDDWPATRRVLEGRRLLTPADDARFARLHRVLGAHLRHRLADPETEQRLDTFLQGMSEELQAAATPDTALLAVTATTIAGRLADGRHNLAAAGLWLIAPVQSCLDLATAATLATATLNSWESLTKADPHNTDWQRNLSVSLRYVASALAFRSDTAGAVEHMTRSMHIGERLAGVDPHNTLWQHDLSTSLEVLGDFLALHGDTDAALEHYTRLLDMAVGFVEADPENPERALDVAASMEKMGQVWAARGDTERALGYYAPGLRLREQFAELDPHNTRWQAALADRLSEMGDVLALRDDLMGTLEHYTRSMHIRERLAEADPHNRAMQYLLAMSLFKVALMLESAGDPAAIDHFAKAHHILAALDAAGKLDDKGREVLDSITGKLGPTSPHALGGDLLAARAEEQAALDDHSRSLQIAERLAAAEPDNTDYQHTLAVSLYTVAGLLAARGEVPGALDRYGRSWQILMRLSDVDPTNTQYRQDMCLVADRLAFRLDEVGDLFAEQGQLQPALDQYNRVLGILEWLTFEDPHTADYQRNASRAAGKIAQGLEQLGDASAADYWARAHNALAVLAAAGRLDDADRPLLEILTRKVSTKPPEDR